MWDTSRGLHAPLDTARSVGDAVVHGLAKVGLIWALAVLAVVFMVSAAQGQDGTLYSLASAHTSSASGAAGSAGFELDGTAPRTLGLFLVLVILAVGAAILLIAARGGRAEETPEVIDLAAVPIEPDLSLAIGLGLTPATVGAA
jgi:hypothetical protein